MNFDLIKEKTSYSSHDKSWREDLMRHRPMGYGWVLDESEIAKFKLPKFTSKKANIVIRHILADAVMSAHFYPDRKISYSRNLEFWIRISRYTNGWNRKAVCLAVDTLVEMGLLVDHDRRKEGQRGLQSSYRPSEVLQSVSKPKLTVRLPELIQYKDGEGNLVNYKDTPMTIRSRKQLQSINTLLASVMIQLEIDGEIVEHYTDWAGNKICIDENQLHRVYSGGWDKNGRFYGTWFQNIKREDRRYILIDGKPTVEADYSQTHPRLLYTMAGLKLTFDAYDIPGFDRDEVIKPAFNTVINADSYESALHSIKKKLVGGDVEVAAQVIKAITDRHPGISKFFNSGIGLKLQNIDSKMAEIVMQELSVKRGIAVLPIHDSFVVQEEHLELLIRVMENAYKTVTKAEVTKGLIKVKEGRKPSVEARQTTSTEEKVSAPIQEKKAAPVRVAEPLAQLDTFTPVPRILQPYLSLPRLHAPAPSFLLAARAQQEAQAQSNRPRQRTVHGP